MDDQSEVAVFYSQFLCIYTPIVLEFPDNSNIQLFSGNTNQECVLPLGNVSEYRVFLGLLTWESGEPWVGIATFLIQVFKGDEQILGATGNFSSNTNEIYLTNFFGDSLGAPKVIPPPNEGDVARLITITNDVIINKVSYKFKFTYECIISPNVSQFYFNFRNIKLLIDTQGSSNPITTNGTTLLNIINKKLLDSEVNVFIQVQTDMLGLELGEMYCRLDADEIYPNSYPQEHIGECVGYKIPTDSKIKNTFYSFKPNLKKVLKLEGNVLYQQTKNINDEYDTGLNDCEFYLNILVYSTLRYIFAGLSNNSVFSIKWLYSNNYEKFLRNLEESEFSAAVALFTEPQDEFDFSNYNIYYRKCNCNR